MISKQLNICMEHLITPIKLVKPARFQLTRLKLKDGQTCSTEGSVKP